jgi:hypothetical protein
MLLRAYIELADIRSGSSRNRRAEGLPGLLACLDWAPLQLRTAFDAGPDRPRLYSSRNSWSRRSIGVSRWGKYAEPHPEIHGRIYFLEEGYVGKIWASFMAKDRQQLGLASDYVWGKVT